LTFASKRLAKTPAALDIAELDAPLIAAFLDHLERDRRNSAATRNNRLAAIHSLFGYLALHHPEHAGSIQRVLAIPPKRTERNLVTYLTDPEVDALLDACDLTTWTGRRDHAMFALTIQAGLRISELAGLTRQDVTLTVGANVHTIGKGRKERRTPLVAPTKAILHAWLSECPGAASDPLFPTITGSRLSRDAIERRLAHHVESPPPAAPRCGRNRHHAYPAAHHLNAAPTRRQRHHHHRALAGPRADRDDQHLPARRHDPQAASDRPHQTTRHQTRSLPAPRLTPQVPGGPLIMPTSSGGIPYATRTTAPRSA
jgi:integrase